MKEPTHGHTLPQQEATAILSVRKIWDHAPHNAFPDLIRYQNKWFCAFREGATHLSNDGKTRVISSDDGARWNSEALLPASAELMELKNLCDASLSATPEGKLLLSAGAWHVDWPKQAPIMMQTVAWLSPDGREWEGPFKIGHPNFWLWKTIWRKGQAFNAGRGVAAATRGLLRLYTSADGRQWDIRTERMCVQDIGVWPDETSLAFLPDDTAVCLTRCHYADPKRRETDAWLCPAMMGRSRPPYTEWQWMGVEHPVAAPKLLALPDGRLLAAGREWTGASWNDQLLRIWLVDIASGKLNAIETLPSGGDSSYCGMVYLDGVIYVAYYSSHEGKTSVYFAEVMFPAPRR